MQVTVLASMQVYALIVWYHDIINQPRIRTLQLSRSVINAFLPQDGEDTKGFTW